MTAIIIIVMAISVGIFYESASGFFDALLLLGAMLMIFGILPL